MGSVDLTPQLPEQFARLASRTSALERRANRPSSRLVTALPFDPYDGQRVRYLASAAQGCEWHLVYDAGAASPYKWKCIGGSFLRANSGLIGSGVQGGTSGTVWMMGASHIGVPLSGDYEGIASVANFNYAGNVTFVDIHVAAKDAGSGGPANRWSDARVRCLNHGSGTASSATTHGHVLGVVAGGQIGVGLMTNGDSFPGHEGFNTAFSFRPVRVK